jgi:hypothetical protein
MWKAADKSHSPESWNDQVSVHSAALKIGGVSYARSLIPPRRLQIRSGQSASVVCVCSHYAQARLSPPLPAVANARVVISMAPLILLLLIVLHAVAGAGATSVAFSDRGLVIDGERRILISGSIHYPRSTPEVR